MAPFMPWSESKYEGIDARFEKMRPSKERLKNVLDCNVVGSERDDPALALTTFPRQIAKLRADNVQESAKREIKRRYRVVQSFRSRELMLRLSRASLMEAEGQWC